jgi:hypothetical protein
VFTHARPVFVNEVMNQDGMSVRRYRKNGKSIGKTLRR